MFWVLLFIFFHLILFGVYYVVFPFPFSRCSSIFVILPFLSFMSWQLFRPLERCFSYILYVSILYEHIMTFFDNARFRHHLFHHNELLQNRNTNKR
jgi:hypothetical protein